MAKSFVVKVIAVLILYLLISGIITASDNTSRTLTGRQPRTVDREDIKNFINDEILNRK